MKLNCPICNFKMLDVGDMFVCVEHGTINKMRIPVSMIKHDSIWFEILCRIPFIVYAFILIGVVTSYFNDNGHNSYEKK